MKNYIILSQNISLVLTPNADVNLLTGMMGLIVAQTGLVAEDLLITRYLKNPQIEVMLRDFPITEFPEELNSKLLTDLERNLLIRNNEWQAENQIYIEFKQRSNTNNPWVTIGAIVALNRDRSPYPLPGVPRAMKVVDGLIELGINSEIAIKVIPTIGLSSNDKLVFTALYEERAYIKPKRNRITNCINQSWSVNTAGVQVLSNQSNRASFRIFNNGDKRVWLNLGQLNGIGTGDPIQPGDFREYSAYDNDQYTLPIWLLAEEGTQQVSGTVCFY